MSLYEDAHAFFLVITSIEFLLFFSSLVNIMFNRLFFGCFFYLMSLIKIDHFGHIINQ